jgi:hypothetical protein
LNKGNKADDPTNGCKPEQYETSIPHSLAGERSKSGFRKDLPTEKDRRPDGNGSDEANYCEECFHQRPFPRASARLTSSDVEAIFYGPTSQGQFAMTVA